MPDMLPDTLVRWKASAMKEMGYVIGIEAADDVLLRSTVASRVYKLALRIEVLRANLSSLNDPAVNALLEDDREAYEDEFSAEKIVQQ